MSTIAYRGGVMASDSRAYTRDQHPIGSKRKARRLPDGTLVGVSSNIPGASEAVTDWYARGADAEDKPTADSFVLLAVRPDGSAFYAKDHYLLSGPLEGEFFAIGSGSDAALGAMHMGATAARAVEVATITDPWTGGPIHTLTH